MHVCKYFFSFTKIFACIRNNTFEIYAKYFFVAYVDISMQAFCNLKIFFYIYFYLSFIYLFILWLRFAVNVTKLKLQAIHEIFVLSSKNMHNE